jgi:signal transduction histidine kinase
MLKPFRYLLAIVIGIYILSAAVSYDKVGYIHMAFIFISSIEILRVVYFAIKRKKNNASVIGAGVSVFVVGILLLIIVGLIRGQLNNVYEYIAFILLFSIPVSMSIYLARSSSQTNKSLETQITSVKNLSEQNLLKEQEKQQILANQNELLEQQVNERTADLNHSLNELKSTQSQLIQSEKMASLGELTAGIAHEIQNPLNFVNNFSEINTELVDELKSELVKGSMQSAIEIADSLKENELKINHHGKRADAIVKGMLQHSRSSSGVKEPTDINKLADEYLRLAYHGLRAKDKSFNATMKTDFDESIGNINIIPQDIGRVVLNLINNAFYVVDEKKKSYDPPEADTSYEPTVTVSTKKVSDKVLVSVKDNGNGIPQKVLDKIFQPFFTTKPTGQGTGLGLSLSYDIIKAHGGEIKVNTKENEGTEFTIQLPIS